MAGSGYRTRRIHTNARRDVCIQVNGSYPLFAGRYLPETANHPKKDTMTDIVGMEDITPAAGEARGEPASDYVWGWNGIRPDGQKFSIDPVRFIMFAQECHPEWIDSETGEILVMDVVLTAQDALEADKPEFEGTVAVTIRPDLGVFNWDDAARDAAERYRANPKVAARFRELARLFKENAFWKKDDLTDKP